jgi:tetratricopeptide (TPR) repeat protein
MLTKNLKILLTGVIVCFSISLFSQGNRLDNVAKSMDAGKFDDALTELEDIIANATTALPARAFQYEFNIYRHYMSVSKTANDSSEWHNRMMGAFIGCQEAANPTDVLVYMANVLKQHMIEFRLLATRKLITQDFDTFHSYNIGYIQSAILFGEPVKELAYQSAELAKAQGRLELAEIYYRTAIQMNFEVQLSIASWISLLRVKKDYETASQVLQLAHQKYPDNNIEMLVKALEHYDKKLYFTALKEVNDLLETEKSNHNLYYLLGLINLKTERFDAAIDAFHKTEEMGHETYMTNYQLGIHYLEDGIKNKDASSLWIAEFSFSQCERIQNNDLFLYNALIQLYSEMNDEKNLDRIIKKLTEQ